jgi:hypothetical protein
MAGKSSGKTSSFRTGGAHIPKMQAVSGGLEKKGAPIPAMQPVSTTPAPSASAGSGASGGAQGASSHGSSGTSGSNNNK